MQRMETKLRSGKGFWNWRILDLKGWVVGVWEEWKFPSEIGCKWKYDGVGSGEECWYDFPELENIGWVGVWSVYKGQRALAEHSLNIILDISILLMLNTI